MRDFLEGSTDRLSHLNRWVDLLRDFQVEVGDALLTVADLETRESVVVLLSIHAVEEAFLGVVKLECPFCIATLVHMGMLHDLLECVLHFLVRLGAAIDFRPHEIKTGVVLGFENSFAICPVPPLRVRHE